MNRQGLSQARTLKHRRGHTTDIIINLNVPTYLQFITKDINKMAIGQTPDFNIIIVGAGPSGLLLALLLAKQNIPVTVLEKNPELDKQPRASFYSAPALHEFARAGILDDVDERAFHAHGVGWRHIDGTTICTILDHDYPKELKRRSLPLDQLLPLISRHLEGCECARVLLGYEVLGLGEEGESAWVDVRGSGGEERMHATYAVGCDGGNSKVRRELLGPGAFQGKTWDAQIVATNVSLYLQHPPAFFLTIGVQTYYPAMKNYDWASSTFLVHPDHFPMIAQISNDGLLRITYGEEGNLRREEMLQRQPDKFKQFVPGAPEPSEYKIVNFSPYRIHQRCAERMRKGRFLLAADAAHLCNPL